MINVELYINDRRVDLAEDFSLAMTYQAEDLTNPTIVKNAYSKTITLKGTPTNNKVFGDLWRLDAQVYQFNPSQRVPFSLYKNADLIESGYVQLDNITRDKDNNLTYQVHLFGGLGDFFYSLKYDEDGETKTLADLTYDCEDELAVVEVNKTLVSRSLTKVAYDGDSLLDTLAFVPSYNGLPENFDADKCICKLTDSNNILPTSQGSYTSKNGYALVGMSKEMTEWEMTDLRSYLQRPAIKFSKFLDAVCKPTNNGGYNVELDPAFFNERNPYYTKTFLALPLLGNILDKDDVSEEATLTQYDNFAMSGTRYSFSDALTGTSAHVTTSGRTITLNNVPTLATMKVSCDFSIFADAQSSADTLKFYSGAWQIQEAIVAQVKVISGIDTIAYSDVMCFESNFGSRVRDYRISDTFNAPITFKDCVMRRAGENRYVLQTTEGGNTFNLGVEFPRVEGTTYRIVLDIQRVSTYGIPHTSLAEVVGTPIDASTTASVSSSSLTLSWSGDIVGGLTIKKAELLKTDKTPCDILLDYCKMFGLSFLKDKYSNTIAIRARNTAYNGKVVDISKYIDDSQNRVITPITFDSKHYRMQLEGVGDYYTDKYKTDYNEEYGSVKISTSYNFDSDIKDLVTDSSFDNVCSVRNASPYFRTFRNASSIVAPPFLKDGGTLTLYNGDDTTEVSLVPKEYISTITDWYKRSGQDNKVMIGCFSKDGDKESLADISMTLVMLNGVKALKDINGYPTTYHITDDIPAMGTLNEGKPCWLWTTTDAVNITSLAQYSRFDLDGIKVLASLDYGRPKEIYADGLDYSSATSIYGGYWQKLLSDQMDINTRKVTVYLLAHKLGKVDERLFSNFYWFDNCIWVLNKIENYDATKEASVKCEFIKVIETGNYTKGQREF